MKHDNLVTGSSLVILSGRREVERGDEDTFGGFTTVFDYFRPHPEDFGSR